VIFLPPGIVIGGPKPLPFVSWDKNTKTSGIVLSDPNVGYKHNRAQVDPALGSNTYQNVRGMIAFPSSTGKYYVEFIPYDRVGCAIGVCNTSAALGFGTAGSANWLGVDANSAGAWTQTWWYNGINEFATAPNQQRDEPLGQGNIWSACFDLNLRKAWFRASNGGSFTWNSVSGGIVTGDPVGGTNGLNIPTGTLYLAFTGEEGTIIGNSDECRIYPSTLQSFTPPSGYSRFPVG
jgi:hypothetical protein